MKRVFTILIFALAFSNIAFAQLPDGAIGPDFTATDIDGVEHNLYDLLNEGKSVVLDVSATWCPPCWTYHNESHLKDIWETYGPDGTDEMYVFMIEADASTTMADLQGTTAATEGDWITGTPYPIIDNATIGDQYEITYFPTLFHVCPNKTVTEIGQVTAPAFFSAHNNCEVWTNNVGIASYTGDDNNACGTATAVTPEVTFLNLGSANLTSCMVEFLMDGVSIQTQEWTGDLANLESGEISFDDVEVLNFAEFSFVMSLPNGVADDGTDVNTVSKQIGSNTVATTNVEFEITTDFWPEEIDWQLKDANGVVLYSNIDLGALGCDETYTQSYDLNAGDCYTFSIQDGFGDGLLNTTVNPGHGCGTANGVANVAVGAISLTSGNGVLWNNITYGSGTDIDFIVEAGSATQEVALNALDIYPNPATDNVTVAFDIAETTRLEVAIYNVYGQQVTTTGFNQYGTGSNTVNVNTASLATGIYFISISEGDKVTSRKISILK